MQVRIDNFLPIGKGDFVRIARRHSDTSIIEQEIQAPKSFFRLVEQVSHRVLIGDVEDRFAVDDKVIQTRNDYDLGVMNGTIGFVREVEKRQLMVEFEGVGVRPVPRSLWIHLDLAYALTAHKAQGSEFPCAVVLCHKSHFFADRNWLYTAVTRAAQTCILIGDDYGLRRAARHVRNMNRRTLISLWSTRDNKEAAA